MGVSKFDCAYEIRGEVQDILDAFRVVILDREDNPTRMESRYSIKASFVPDSDYVTMQVSVGYKNNRASLSVEFSPTLPPLEWPLHDESTATVGEEPHV